MWMDEQQKKKNTFIPPHLVLLNDWQMSNQKQWTSEYGKWELHLDNNTKRKKNEQNYGNILRTEVMNKLQYCMCIWV